MPKIREYRNTLDKFTLDEKAYQAEEMAGRRIGPLYGQAGTELGKVAKDAEEAAKLGALDVSEYEKEVASHQASRAAGRGSAAGGGGGGSAHLPRDATPHPRATGPAAAARLTGAAASTVASDPTTGLKLPGNPGGKELVAGTDFGTGDVGTGNWTDIGKVSPDNVQFDPQVNDPNLPFDATKNQNGGPLNLGFDPSSELLGNYYQPSYLQQVGSTISEGVSSAYNQFQNLIGNGAGSSPDNPLPAPASDAGGNPIPGTVSPEALAPGF